MKDKKIELYCDVLLKDGRRASIVEIFDNEYIADIEISVGEYDTQSIKPEQIEKVL